MSFRTRTLLSPESVGERLRQLREEARISLDQLASELNIAVKHLEAIEASRYQDLPGKVYARNFVRRYIERVGLNVDSAMEKFDQEYTILTAPQQRRNPILPQRATTSHPWWQRNARLIVATIIVLLVGGYFGWQIIRLVTPPELLVTAPSSDTLTTSSTYRVVGTADPGSEVRINNELVEVNEAGEFTATLDLQSGVNTIKIAAKKKRSGERVVIRQILYETKSDQ